LRAIRITIQLGALALFICLILVNSYPHAYRYPVDFFMRLDPYAAVTSMLATRSFILRLVPSFIVIGSALLLGRIFCGYFCPLGTILDCSSRLFRLKPRVVSNRTLRNLKYVILFFTLSAAVFGVTAVHFFDPIAVAERSGIFVMREVISGVLGALGDSIGPIGDYLNISFLERRFYNLAALFALIFGVIIILETITRRFWCRYLCPLGAMLLLLGRLTPISRKVSSACNSCGRCKHGCVFDAVDDDPRLTRHGECTLCLRCERFCAAGAIGFGLRDSQTEGISLERRALAASVVSGIVYGLIIGGRGLAAGRQHQVIRPPGAVPEDQFLAACTRCGTCIGACLTGGLQPSLLEAGFEGMWTPILVGRLGGCEAECNLCGKVCHTQAIRYIELEQKKKVKIGRAVIDRDLCLAWKEERVCYICDEICPFDSIEFVHTEDASIDKPRVKPDKCTGCGLCEWKCPVTPPAIYVTPQGADRS
jgi:MauM/NapG family ferredoxin protein